MTYAMAVLIILAGGIALMLYIIVTMLSHERRMTRLEVLRRLRIP